MLDSGHKSNNPEPQGCGVFIVFEGIDGSGKTTQALRLVKELEEQGIKSIYVKEPTSGKWGREIKEIAAKGRDNVSLEEELNFFVLDREEDVRLNIRPVLDDGGVVIADRYFYSNIAYQSSLGLKESEIRSKNAEFPVPDKVFLLEVSPECGRQRINTGRMEEANQGYEQLDFLTQVKQAYDGLADSNIVRLDGTQEIEVIADLILEQVQPLLNP